MGASLCVINVLDVRAGFDVDTNHVFPQSVLATITLIVGVVGVGGSKACAGCETGLSLAP